MKKVLLATALLLSMIANAQTIKFTANTGDAELDVTLTDMNAKAQLDIPLFKTDMKASFSITDGKLDKLLLTMAPGDVYFALEIAKQLSKPVDDVVKAYESNKKKGWGVIAKELGIKPGSPEFHALKGKAKNKNSKGGKPNKTGKPSGNGNKGKGKK